MEHKMIACDKCGKNVPNNHICKVCVSTRLCEKCYDRFMDILFDWLAGSTPTLPKKVTKQENFDGKFFGKCGELVGSQISLFGEHGEKRE